MSAPPGWHPQPDGRDRWWDGEQWTEHFRDPAGEGVTQTLPAGGHTGGYQGAEPGWQPPQKQGMSRGLKGCLITGVVVALLLAIGAIAAVFFFARSVDRAVDEASSAFPSGFPTELPSDFPSDLPSNLPTTGGQTIVIALGDGFDAAPDAQVGDGWTLEDSAIGSQIEGMTVTFADGRTIPVAFTMAFSGPDGARGAETVCTAVPRDGQTSVGATCIPVFGDVADDPEVTVTTAF